MKKDIKINVFYGHTLTTLMELAWKLHGCISDKIQYLANIILRHSKQIIYLLY